MTRTITTTLVALAAVLAAGCATAGTAAAPAGRAGGARAELAQLATAAPATRPLYDRVRQFGPAWSVDTDHNRCDARNDVLRRDLVDVTPATGCVVRFGTLVDPYTGRTIRFRRGVGTSAAVQIDHVYPLHAAWQHGAAAWSQATRERYANDPIVLLASDGPTNESKGDQTPGEWLPPRRAGWCDYATRYVHIAATYRLSVTAADRAALAGALDTC